MNSKRNIFSVRNMVILGMLSALAYIVMVFLRIPVVAFLKYDPKDIVITIGGLIFGPFSAFTMSLVVSVIEMFTVSDTGWIGLLMNILSTCSFACTAAFIYKLKHNLKGAVIGIISGVLIMTPVMLLWNFLITPLYMKVTREAVTQMLIPTFLPFNLLKGGLNAAFTLLLYKPVINALRKQRLITSYENTNSKSKMYIGIVVFSLIIILTCVLFILILQGII